MKFLLIIVMIISLSVSVGCDAPTVVPATMPPETVSTVTPNPTATLAPTPSPAPTPAPPTPIPLKAAPFFTWDKPSIDLPDTLYATYRLKDEPIVNIDSFPDLIWDGKEYETTSEDETSGRYILRGSPFPNYREELSVTKRNSDTDTIGANCWWNWNGKEHAITMYEGSEQDAKAEVEAYFGKALGSEYMGTLSRFVVERTVNEKKIYTVYYYRNIDGIELANPAISAYIAAEGFRYYYLDFAEYQRDSSQVIEQPITFEEALYSLNYYFETRSGHPDFLRDYILSDVRLMLSFVFTDEYMAMKPRASLNPVWAFHLTKDKPDMDMTVEEYVFVDVRTGRIYNGSNPGGMEDSPFPR